METKVKENYKQNTDKAIKPKDWEFKLDIEIE
jgi:hypothetical protein